MVHRATPYLMSGVSIVTVHIENQQSVYGDVYLEKKIDLNTSDHMIVGFYSVLIFLALKLTQYDHIYLNILGWFFIWMNIMSFDAYAIRRKNAN